MVTRINWGERCTKDVSREKVGREKLISAEFLEGLEMSRVDFPSLSVSSGSST